LEEQDGAIVVGFEDQRGESMGDFNDVLIRLRGGVMIAHAPSK
jgi:hypothetical protein